MRQRYVEQRRSANEIATETGWSGQYWDRLGGYGIPLCAPGSPKTAAVTRADLEEWIVAGGDIADIAARVGYSRSG